MKRVLKIILPFLILAAGFVLYHAAVEPDRLYYDCEGHWAESKIEKWSAYGVIGGSDGVFRPDEGVTRAEMCTIISRVAQLPPAAENEYSDLEDGQWYAEVMLRCIAAGVLQPEDEFVRPDKEISRGEGLEMLLIALGADREQGVELLSDHYRSDGAANNFGYDDVFPVDDSLRQLKEGNLDPDAPLSRAELVLMLDACQAEGYLNME